MQMTLTGCKCWFSMAPIGFVDLVSCCSILYIVRIGGVGKCLSQSTFPHSQTIFYFLGKFNFVCFAVFVLFLSSFYYS
ncbi:hypothetical protein FOCC_FOCC015457 [Frankliniella occidentalis]|nr:hypothetical protein FOCC_FOCC015457 [Frankliniella occidentalis]